VTDLVVNAGSIPEQSSADLSLSMIGPFAERGDAAMDGRRQAYWSRASSAVPSVSYPDALLPII